MKTLKPEPAVDAENPSPALALMDENAAVKALAALAQIQRLRAFRALVAVGQKGLTPGVMAANLGISPSALSFHLKELVHAGLAHSETQGQFLLYRAQFAHMAELLAFLTANCCEGQGCEASEQAAQRLCTIKVLFLCTHNSARSILGEALLNHIGQGRFQAYSAGSQPKADQQPNPLALAALQKAGYPVDGLASKSWDTFGQPDSPQMDLVITVCDNAAGEVCPYWPGQPATAHWGYPDPSAGDGTEAEKMAAFRDTLHAMRRRMELLVNLPAAGLNRLTLQTQARALGLDTASA